MAEKIDVEVREVYRVYDPGMGILTGGIPDACFFDEGDAVEYARYRWKSRGCFGRPLVDLYKGPMNGALSFVDFSKVLVWEQDPV